MVARGLSGVSLVTSDAHRGLVEAIGATLPGASWQRCRTHYAANLMSATPKSAWGWVKALLHSVYDQPDTDAVQAQFDRILDALADKLPAVAHHLESAPTSSPSPPFRRRHGGRSGPITPKNGSIGRSAAAPMSSASNQRVRRLPPITAAEQKLQPFRGQTVGHPSIALIAGRYPCHRTQGGKTAPTTSPVGLARQTANPLACRSPTELPVTRDSS